jgi:hypothetical protein
MTTVIAVIALIEFFGVGTLGSFNVAIELGRAWRQHEEPDAALLAGGLEAGGKFTASVDLNGPNGKGHALLQVGQTPWHTWRWPADRPRGHPSSR